MRLFYTNSLTVWDQSSALGSMNPIGVSSCRVGEDVCAGVCVCGQRLQCTSQRLQCTSQRLQCTSQRFAALDYSLNCTYIWGTEGRSEIDFNFSHNSYNETRYLYNSHQCLHYLGD